MANRLSRNAPYQIMEVDVHQINDVFRQIQQAVDELRGLQGPVTIFDEVTFSDPPVLPTTAFAGTSTIADVAATEAAGTSTLIPRGDHVHKADHGSIAGLADDDHSLYPLVTNFEADRATIAINWEDLTDGGETTLHSHAGSSEGTESDFSEGSDNEQPWEQIQSNEDTIRVDNHAQGNAVELRALQAITMGGDPEVTFAQFLTDDDGNVIYG